MSSIGQTSFEVPIDGIKDIGVDSLNRVLALDHKNNAFIITGSSKYNISNEENLKGFTQSENALYAYNNFEIFRWNPSLEKWDAKSKVEDHPIEKLYFAKNEFLCIHTEHISIGQEKCYSKTEDQAALKNYSYQCISGQWYGFQGEHLMKICDEIGHYYLPDSILSIIPNTPKLTVCTRSGIYEVNDSFLNKINLEQDTSWYPIISTTMLDNQRLLSTASGNYILTDKLQIQVTNTSYKADHKIIERDGQVFCLNEKGIDVFKAKPNPKIWIDLMKYKGELLARSNKITMASGEQSLIVQLATTHWQADAATFSYQLEGVNMDWKPFNIHEALIIPLEGKKDIKLHVKRNYQDKTFTQRDILSIHLTDPHIPTWIKYILMGLSLALIISAFSFIRLKNYKQKFETLKEQLSMQQTLQEEQNKVRQLQMSPHFLYNALNSINGLIALNENKKARKYLNEFSQLMRAQLNQNASSAVSLSEEVQLLTKYMSLEQLCHQDKFDFYISYPKEMANELTIPGMLIQPFAENAVKHGMRWKESKGMISIHFEKEGNHLRCTIEDDGVGRKVSSSKKDDTHQSVAIDFIKERLSNYFKFKSINEIISFEDKVENGVAKGTIVRLIIPILGKHE